VTVDPRRAQERNGDAITHGSASVTLEELNRAFMPFRCLSGLERSEIAAPTGTRIALA
jgi:hypothetical protein